MTAESPSSSFVFKATKFAEFNKYVTKLIQRNVFVGIHPIFEQLKLHNIKYNYGLDDNQMLSVAGKAYDTIIMKMKKLRWKKLESKYCAGEPDPAIGDTELSRKLQEHAAKSEQQTEPKFKR